MFRGMRFVVVALALVGCSKKQQDGLPPATEWQAANSGAMAPSVPGNPSAPSAVVPQSADPHAGLGIPPASSGMSAGGADPHAGMDMTDPHGGSSGGVDVSKLGLPPPDPNRKIDPTHRVAGIIKVHPRAKDKVKPNGAIFLMVKRPGPDGQPMGSPLAVDRVTWTQDGMAFELTEAQAMVAGTELTGDVIMMARYDQDSDAISKQPGDVTGQMKVKIPADKLVLTLDTVLP
jgi:hypothetical protein